MIALITAAVFALAWRIGAFNQLRREPFRLLLFPAYEWRVWPAIDKRRAHRYGPLLGHSTFILE
jgi:hypothetical protein